MFAILKKSVPYNVVTVSLSAKSVSCCWLRVEQPGQHSLDNVTFAAYAKELLPLAVVIDGHLFHGHALVTVVQAFIRRYAIADPYIAWSFDNAVVEESIVFSAHASPDATYFHEYYKPRAHNVHVYLYPNNHNMFSFYLCSLQHVQLFQHSLLMHAINSKCLAVTSDFMAWFAAYKQTSAAHFLRTSFAHAMEKHENKIQSLFDADGLASSLRIVPTMYRHAQERILLVQPLLRAYGLFLIGANAHENA